MPSKRVLKELCDIRSQKFPLSCDFLNVMKKPHEYYKDNATFAVYLFKVYTKISENQLLQSAHSFDQTYLNFKSHSQRVNYLFDNQVARTCLEELVDELIEDDHGQAQFVKHKQMSEDNRKNGNKAFNRKEFDKALVFYNKVSSN